MKVHLLVVGHRSVGGPHPDEAYVEALAEVVNREQVQYPLKLIYAGTTHRLQGETPDVPCDEGRRGGAKAGGRGHDDGRGLSVRDEPPAQARRSPSPVAPKVNTTPLSFTGTSTAMIAYTPHNPWRERRRPRRWRRCGTENMRRSRGTTPAQTPGAPPRGPRRRELLLSSPLSHLYFWHK